MEKGLLESERIIVGSLILIIISLVIIAKTAAFRSSSEIPIEISSEEAYVTVHIQGAVAHPGDYTVPVGTEFKKILSKAKPKKFADLRSINLKQMICEPITLEIAELKEIKIQIVGAVKNSILLTLHAGTRVCDLKEKIDLEAWAAPDALKSRRMLVDGEVFEVSRIGD